MYNYKSKIKYSECDKDLNISITALVNYFQDSVSFQAEEVGFGPTLGKEQNIGWILSSWQITINRYPKFCDEITISTWPYKIKGFFVHRSFVIYDSNNNVLAYANSILLLIDTAKNKLLRIPEEIQAVYTLEVPYPLSSDTSKIKLPDNSKLNETFKIQKFHIDSNNHVNNEKYISMALDYIPSNAKVSIIRVEYKKAAVLGDIIFPYSAVEDNKATVFLCNKENKPYANIYLEF